VRRRAGLLHQLRGLAQIGVHTRGIDHADHLALLGDRAGIHHLAHLAADRQRLAGQRRLIDAEIVAIEQLDVRGQDVAQAHAHDVARHQLRGVDLQPLPVAFDPAFERELFLEGIERAARLVFLPETDCGVEQQQQDDDDEVRPMPHQRGQQRGHLDHPRNRPPEIAQQPHHQAEVLLGQAVGADLRQALRCLACTQALGAGLQGLQQIGRGHRRDGLGVER
jgi:hypothetical protein